MAISKNIFYRLVKPHMQQSCLVALIAIALAVPAFAQSPSRSAQTAGELLLDRQREYLTPSVVYCAQEFPEHASDLQQANEKFRDIATEATRPLRERMGELLNQPLPEGGELPDPSLLFLEQGKRQGAAGFCPSILRTMQTVTVEELRQTTEAAFARFERIAAEKKAKGK